MLFNLATKPPSPTHKSMSRGNLSDERLGEFRVKYHTSPANHSARERERAPLPTRVSNACDRCRRNKSRCDAFRPCSLCLRANAQCLSSVSESGRRQKRRKGQNPQSYQSNTNSPETRTGEDKRSVDPNSDITSLDNDQFMLQSPETDEAQLRSNSISDSPTIGHQEAESTMGIARRIFQLDSQSLGEPAASAMPDGEGSTFASNSGQATPRRFPILSILGCSLPTADLMRMLLEEYFESVHWFSLVIYEPKFRAQFESICDGQARPTQRTFLLLLSTVLGIAAWYRSKRTQIEPPQQEVDWSAWASKLIKHIESQLFDILNQSSLATIQTCILLGSYNSYHGKPKSAFALLGATIKTAQAIGLHRQSRWQEVEDSEERKRTWWSIYTWDRWASITYGRPLCIKDHDCNTPMPGDIYERFHFKTSTDRNALSICYSAYQRELNKLYVISSPMIESIFGRQPANNFTGELTGDFHSELGKKVSKELNQWRECLPPHLVLDFNYDIHVNASALIKAHRLQALALQLTFDHLVIILHRPFLVQQISNLTQKSPGTAAEMHSPSSSAAAQSFCPDSQLSAATEQSNSRLLSNSEEWWNAAVRTSRVTQLPHLARIAIDGHLVAFLAMNLFNSAIVMVICALSNPLSDRAQVAKRNITRIFRLQELFGQRSKLSMQSSVILRNVIRLIVQREADAMLTPNQSSEGSKDAVGDETRLPPHLTTEESLRLPNSTLPEPVMSSPSVATNIEDRELLSEDPLRLNESLFSLQRVFQNNDFNGLLDYSRGLPNQQHLQNSELTANLGFWGNDLLGDDINARTQRNLEHDNLEDGLYWMWNSVDDGWA